MGTTAQNHRPVYAVGPQSTRPRVRTKGVPHSRACQCPQCVKRRGLIDAEGTRFAAGRRQNVGAELGDAYRNTDRPEVTYFAMTEQLHEGSHVYDVTVKDALMRKVDRFSVRRAYDLMAQLYPDDFAAFVLAYPLDDDAKAPGDPAQGEETLAQRLLSFGRRTAIQQKVIASHLHVTDSTVTRRLERARTHFRLLYIGIAPPSAIVEALTPDRNDDMDEAG